MPSYFPHSSKFRHLKALCLAYMKDMTLGELQDLAIQLMQRRRHFPPGRGNIPPPPPPQED